MGFGRRGERRFKEEIIYAKRDVFARGWQWNAQDGMGKNEPRQARCACRGCDSLTEGGL